MHLFFNRWRQHALALGVAALRLPMELQIEVVKENYKFGSTMIDNSKEELRGEWPVNDADDSLSPSQTGKPLFL